MKRFPLSAAALALTFFTCLTGGDAQEKKSAEAGNDWILIPERRAGPITKEWTGADLMRAFGSLHCREEEIPVGEGETETGYRIFAGTDDELEVMISAETGKVYRVVLRCRFEEIRNAAGEWIGSRMVGRKSRWHSVSGITLGSTLEEVEKVNGGPFTMEGWEIDYPGAVSSWEDGKIPVSFHARLMYGDEVAYGKWWAKVTGGGEEFDGSSGNVGLRALKAAVYHLSVDL